MQSHTVSKHQQQIHNQIAPASQSITVQTKPKQTFRRFCAFWNGEFVRKTDPNHGIFQSTFIQLEQSFCVIKLRWGRGNTHTNVEKGKLIEIVCVPFARVKQLKTVCVPFCGFCGVGNSPNWSLFSTQTNAPPPPPDVVISTVNCCRSNHHYHVNHSGFGGEWVEWVVRLRYRLCGVRWRENGSCYFQLAVSRVT